MSYKKTLLLISFFLPITYLPHNLEAMQLVGALGFLALGFGSIQKALDQTLKKYLDQGYVNIVRYTDQQLEESAKTGNALENLQERKVIGLTALMMADSLEYAQLLLNAGADVNTINQHGSTALMYAPNIAIAQLLFDAGADIDAIDNEGNTILMYYIQGIKAGQANRDVNPELVKWFLSTYAMQKPNQYANYLNKENKDGQTALMLASSLNNPEIVSVLQNKVAIKALITQDSTIIHAT